MESESESKSKSKSKSHPNKFLQIFIQSPDFHLPTQTLTLTPPSSQTLTSTLHHLKLSLLPNPSSFYFTLNGKPLNDSTLLSASQITPLSTLILRRKLLGGGGDGGATGAESRDCYLNMYAEKKPDKVDPNEQRLSKWLNCALSHEPLREPCVVDKLGNIFNKEALVEALLGKKVPKEFGHMKGLRDMIKIELCRIPGVDFGSGSACFQCPITGLEVNGKYKFFALRNCGHVLSAKALKEVKSSSCLVCHEEFKDMDKIVINGNEEEVAALRERMEQEKGKVKEKKTKKVKNGEVRVVGIEEEEGAQVIAGGKRGVDGNGSGNGNGKVVENGSSKRFKAIDHAPANATKDVYASIFTSSKKGNFKETFTCRSLPLGRN